MYSFQFGYDTKPLNSGVPSEIRGLQYLHDNYGVLPWATVVMPAVNVARNGFRVSPDLVRYMSYATANGNNFLVDDPNWAIDFAPEGKLVKVNQTMYRRRYADTLDTIARMGPDVFYTGDMAEEMITTIQVDGGIMTMDDLRNYTIISRPAAQIKYRDFVLSSCGAPAGGSVSLAMLKIIEGFPDMGEASSVNISTHRMDEAMRFAYAARSNLGDPAYAEAGFDTQNYEENMLSSSNAAHIRSRITENTHNMSYYNPSGIENPPSHGTSHIVTADASGLAITLTTTINLLFGSQLMVPSSGVILNNEQNDFSIPGKSNAFGYVPSPANYIAPGKRPLSSIAPVIVEHAANRSLYFVVGAAGGSRIITSVVQSLRNVLDRRMTVREALAEPRLHDQLAPDVMTVEWAFDNSTLADMQRRGHEVLRIGPGQSAVQAIRMDAEGGFEAVGEPRQVNALGAVV